MHVNVNTMSLNGIGVQLVTASLGLPASNSGPTRSTKAGSCLSRFGGPYTPWSTGRETYVKSIDILNRRAKPQTRTTPSCEAKDA